MAPSLVARKDRPIVNTPNPKAIKKMHTRLYKLHVQPTIIMRIRQEKQKVIKYSRHCCQVPQRNEDT